VTFSDSRVSKLLQDKFVATWDSVAPVREVTFDLGEGRKVTGTVNGEIAILFCDHNGKVFDILPALQSPAITLRAIKTAAAFYSKHKGQITQKNVTAYHRERMKKVAGARYDTLRKQGKLIFNDDVLQLDGSDVFPKSKKGEDKRDKYINAALDDATRDLRVMAMAKTAALPQRHGDQLIGEAMTVVEPGGLGYYQWQIDAAFLGKTPNGLTREQTYPEDAFPVAKRDLTGNQPATPIFPRRWGSTLKNPVQWRNLLFLGIFKQELKGGKVEYNSESLEAISIKE